ETDVQSLARRQRALYLRQGPRARQRADANAADLALPPAENVLVFAHEAASNLRPRIPRGKLHRSAPPHTKSLRGFGYEGGHLLAGGLRVLELYRRPRFRAAEDAGKAWDGAHHRKQPRGQRLDERQAKPLV